MTTPIGSCTPKSTSNKGSQPNNNSPKTQTNIIKEFSYFESKSPNRENVTKSQYTKSRYTKSQVEQKISKLLQHRIHESRNIDIIALNLEIMLTATDRIKDQQKLNIIDSLIRKVNEEYEANKLNISCELKQELLTKFGSVKTHLENELKTTENELKRTRSSSRKEKKQSAEDQLKKLEEKKQSTEDQLKSLENEIAKKLLRIPSNSKTEIRENLNTQNELIEHIQSLKEEIRTLKQNITSSTSGMIYVAID